MSKSKNQTRTKQKPLAAVTGASSGIGYELAKQFAQNGFDLVVVAENDAIHEAVPAFEELGATVQSVKINLASRKGVEAFYQVIRDLGRPLDAIALNAGVGVDGRFWETALEKELNLVNLNVASTLHLAKLAVKDMVERGSGRILFTSSIASTTPGPYMSVYHASKSFVQSLALGLRFELQDTGVTVTALMPGATETNFFKRADMEDTAIGVAEKDSAEEVAEQGFKALMAGEESVVAGSWKNKAEVILGNVIPESIKAKQAAKGSEPGSASKKH